MLYKPWQVYRAFPPEPWHPNPARILDVKVRVEMLYKLARFCKTFPSEPWHPNPARVSDATVRVEMLYKPPLIITSVLSAFQLPKRIRNEWRQNRPAPLSLLFSQHSSSQRGSAVSEAKLGCSISTPVLLAFQLPRRICSDWLQKSVAAFSHLSYQHSSSHRGSAVSGSKSRSQHFHFCFISIPAPTEDLQ